MQSHISAMWIGVAVTVRKALTVLEAEGQIAPRRQGHVRGQPPGERFADVGAIAQK
jgi:predicted transcriptional regulator